MGTTIADLAAEREILVSACGLVDRCERGKLALSGSEGRAYLAGQVTNDVVGLADGAGQYAALLTHKGKMLADLRILAVGGDEPELLLDCERPALQALFDGLRRTLIGFDAELHKRTLQRGLLSLVGPRAREVAGAEELPAEEHAHRAGTVGGHPVRLIVSDAGIDVLCLAEATGEVRAALQDAGARPVCDEADELARVERGRPRYGPDLDDTVIPEEAGLNDRAVSFDKGCYVGQETVARLHWRGRPNRHLRGLRLSDPVPSGTPLRFGDREVGRLGSSVVSPVHGPIALALVRREAAPGDVLEVEGGATATVVDLPF